MTDRAALRALADQKDRATVGDRATLDDFADAHVTKELEVPILGGRTVIIRTLGEDATQAVEAAAFDGWTVELDEIPTPNDDDEAPRPETAGVLLNVANVMVGDRKANVLAILGGLLEPAVPDAETVGKWPPAVVEFIGSHIRALSGLQSGPRALAELAESGARARS